MMRIIVMSIFVVCVLVGQVAAGTIGYKQITRYMDWEPSCYKPSQPSFYVSDVDSFNWAVEEYNSYVSEVESYITCMESEADADIRTLSQAVSNGYDEKRSEVLNELDSANSDLEMQRSFLEY